MNINHWEDEMNMNKAVSFFAGLLLGGVAGAGTMLLMAPQSGKRTRAKIQNQSIRLRDQTTAAVEDVLTQARSKVQEITGNVQDKIKELE